MRHRVFGRMLAFAACLGALVPLPAASQALYPRDAPKEPGARSWALERAKLPPFTPPRTRENTPDLRGRWGAPPAATTSKTIPMWISARRLRRAYLRSAGRQDSLPAVGLGCTQRASAGLARGLPGEHGRLYPDPQTFCLYAVPRATYRGGFEILQGPGYVVLLYNLGHYYRFIPTDERPRGLQRTSSCGWGTPGVPGRAIRLSST
jgi:hypothetical protein